MFSLAFIVLQHLKHQLLRAFDHIYMQKGRYKFLLLYYSQTSLIRSPKGQSEVSVLERCPYKRGHYDDVTFMTPLTVLSVQ